MEDQAAGWVAVVVGLVALAFTYLTYKRGNGRRELSYVVTTNATLVPPQLAAELKLSHDGADLPNPGSQSFESLAQGTSKSSDRTSSLRYRSHSRG